MNKQDKGFGGLRQATGHLPTGKLEKIGTYQGWIDLAEGRTHVCDKWYYANRGVKDRNAGTYLRRQFQSGAVVVYKMGA